METEEFGSHVYAEKEPTQQESIPTSIPSSDLEK